MEVGLPPCVTCGTYPAKKRQCGFQLPRAHNVPFIFSCSGRYGHEGELGVAREGCVKSVHLQVVLLTSDFFLGA